MRFKLKHLALVLATAGLATQAAQAQEKVVIGYISDLSGLYADLEGKGGLAAIQMAIDDMGGKVLGQPVEVLSVDHQNKPDIAASKAREWIDTAGATMIFAGTNSGVALATAKVAQEKKRVFFKLGVGSQLVSPELVHTRSFDRITDLARQYVRIVRETRAT